MPPTILVVDDEHHHRQICSAILLHHHYHVLLAENGREGVRIAQEMQPDLILLDLRMPVLGGIEALRLLKHDPATAKIPVIAFTADSARSSPAALRREGFTHSIEKPCHPKEIIRVVQQIIDPHVIAGVLRAESFPYGSSVPHSSPSNTPHRGPHAQQLAQFL
jgi:CheY-like chemotaxis protein